MKQAPTSLVVFAVLVSSAPSSPATAQSAPAQAEHLFREGKRLMSEGNIAQACSAFEASHAKDGAASTLLNLADCREKNHQYASAWGHFIDAARFTRGKPDQSPLHRTASDRAARIEERLSYLIINVPADALIEGLTITLNGTPVDEAEWNRRFPVDGGDYKIEGKAPGHEPWSASAKVAAAKDTRSVTVPRFHPAASASPDVTASTRDHTAQARPMTGKRKAAIGAWAIGAGGLAAGLVFELSARDTRDESAMELTDYERQQDLYNAAQQKRMVATVAAGAGVAAIGIGVYLWVRGKPSEPDAITVAPHVSNGHAELSSSAASDPCPFIAPSGEDE